MREALGLPLEAEEGLLATFPADVVHEVRPVEAGERYTVVTWFEERGAIPARALRGSSYTVVGARTRCSSSSRRRGHARPARVGARRGTGEPPR